MASDVYFCPGTREDKEERAADMARGLIDRVWFDESDDIGGKEVLLTPHCGEIHKGSSLRVETYIRHAVVRAIADKVRGCGGTAVFGGTTPVYGFGLRCTPEGHRQVAREHGFSEEMMGAPFLVLDEDGDEVNIFTGYYRLKCVGVPKRICDIAEKGGFLIPPIHWKGHPFSAFGGALKQLWMGLVGRRTKVKVHGDYRASVDPEKCTGCETCVDSCYDHHITFADGKAKVGDGCMGCGGCIEICPSGALNLAQKLPLGMNYEARMVFLRKLVHAAGAAAGLFEGRRYTLQMQQQ